MANSGGDYHNFGPDIERFKEEMEMPRFAWPLVVICLAMIMAIVGLVALLVFSDDSEDGSAGEPTGLVLLATEPNLILLDVTPPLSPNDCESNVLGAAGFVQFGILEEVKETGDPGTIQASQKAMDDLFVRVEACGEADVFFQANFSDCLDDELIEQAEALDEDGDIYSMDYPPKLGLPDDPRERINILERWRICKHAGMYSE